MLRSGPVEALSQDNHRFAAVHDLHEGAPRPAVADDFACRHNCAAREGKGRLGDDAAQASDSPT
jgi:hypothetical protein